jgi:hypothetical protein
MMYNQAERLYNAALKSLICSELVLITFCVLAWISIIIIKENSNRSARAASIGIIFAIAYLCQNAMYPNSGSILNTTQQFVTDQYAAVGLGFSLYGWRRATEGKSRVVKISMLVTSIMVLMCVGLKVF